MRAYAPGMTAVFTVHIVCACGSTYPDKPKESTAKDIRAEAEKRGWQVMHGSHGSDVCPACRIKDIEARADLVRPMLAS